MSGKFCAAGTGVIVFLASKVDHHFMASRYSCLTPHIVSFEDITLPDDFTGIISNPSSLTRTATSMAENQPTSQPTPLFSPEQQAWIDALLHARMSQPQSPPPTVPPMTSSSSSSSLSSRPGNIGKSYSNEDVIIFTARVHDG